MDAWVTRFFELNRTNEVELVDVYLGDVIQAVNDSGWTRDDEIWGPDLHVIRFLRPSGEIFVIEETYFSPKLTGADCDIAQIRECLSNMGPKSDLVAGSRTADPLIDD